MLGIWDVFYLWYSCVYVLLGSVFGYMVLGLVVGVACLMSFDCNIGMEEARDIPQCESEN